jgi:DNA polymerase III alpha subunit
MGLTEDTIARCPRSSGGSGLDRGEERMREIGLDPDDRACADHGLIEEIIGFPRHLSQHVGGFIITEGRLDELVPIENATMEDRTVICWDKDDIDALGILKVDVLALGMLTCIRKAFDLICRRTTRPTTRSPRCRPRIRRSTTCCARPTASACSRWKAGRR